MMDDGIDPNRRSDALITEAEVAASCFILFVMALSFLFLSLSCVSGHLL